MLFDDLKTEYQNVLVAQLSATLCNSMDCSPPGSSVQGVLKASELPLPSPGDLSDPGIELRSPALQAYSLLTKLHGRPQIKPRITN